MTVVATQITDADAGDPPDNPAADTTFSFSVPPVANNDTYAPGIVGNVGVNTATNSGFSILTNDVGSGLAVIADGTSAQGGTVVVAASGTFTYTPPAGYEGADSFTYTVSNAAGTSPAATVNLTVSGMIWFVNNGAVAGDGRLSSPLNTLAAFQAINNGAGNNPAAGDNVFLYESGTSYTGPVTLLSNQKLIGQDATATLASIAGVTVPADSFPLPAMNTGVPATTVSFSGAGNAVTLNSAAATNTVRGLTITTGSTTSVGLAGSTFGTLSANDAIISGSGPALSLSGGAVSAVFASVGSTGGATNVSLTNLTGNLAMNGGALSGATGTAFGVSTGSAVISYAGTITKSNAGRVVNVDGITGGSVTVSGTVTGGSTSTGVNINNANGAVTFSTLNLGTSGARMTNQAVTINGGSGTYALGTVAIYTTSGTGKGISALNANGTLNCTGVVSAVGAAAVDIDGPAGLTTLGMSLTSVSASGGANGIALVDTDGSITVTGDGGGSSNGSGGTIQNTSAAGVHLANVTNVSLNYLNVTNSGTDGISVNTVNGFTLNRSNISDNFGGATDQGIDVGNFVTGTAVNGAITISNSSISPCPHNCLSVGIGSGTSTWNLEGSTFSQSASNSGITFETRGTSVVTALTLSGCTLSDNFATGIQIAPAASATGSITATIEASTFTGNNIAMDLDQNGTATTTYTVRNNTTITGQNSHAINLFTAAGTTGGVFNARLENNSIGNAGVAGSGSAIGNGIRVNVNGNADATVLLDGNTIRQTPNGRGIEVIGRNGTGGLDITITDNDVNPQDTSGFPLAAILVQSNCLTVCNTVRSDVRNNTVPAGGTFDLLPTYISLVESSTSISQLVDTAPASADCTAQLTSTNTGSASAGAGCSLIAGPIGTPP